MTTIGLIGAGNIGQAVARLAVDHGYDVVLSNSRGPETLAEVVASLGDHAHADTVEGAASRGDLVVVTIPLHAYQQVPAAPLRGKVVIDTNNYYPARDGQVPELDDGSATSTGLLQSHLPESRVVKAFNHILAAHLAEHSRPAGSPDRRALAVAGDDPDAKRTVTALLDELGFDVVDVGPLDESWRIQPETPGYGPRLDAAGLRDAIAAAAR
ncbi:MAG TPA: NADPH-dependent F420 reductase [Nocardioidaceae bacterium]|nr:NADPH-dependent F420 reductase [Nocardioidaceae bacterium]